MVNGNESIGGEGSTDNRVSYAVCKQNRALAGTVTSIQRLD